MTTVAIDSDMLSELFDNQKNLDDIFNDDFFLNGPMITGDNVSETSTLKDDIDILYNNDMSSNFENKHFLQNNRRIFNLLAPVILEVTVIAYCISYFT